MALRPNVARLRDMLLKSKAVDEFQMKAAMGRLEQWGGRLTGIIVDMGFMDDETMVKTLSEAMHLQVAHLGMVTKDAQLLAKLDAAYCQEHGIFPIGLQNRVITIAMSDPTEVDAIDYVQSKVGARVQIVVAAESEIRAAIAKHYRGQDVPATSRNTGNHRAREAHIESTKGSIFELDTTEPPKPGEAPSAPAAATPSQAWLKKAPSANTMLDDFLDDGDESSDLSPDELKRLDTARENQTKAAAILRTIQSLLTEKGYL
jgi:hypothetical protein